MLQSSLFSSSQDLADVADGKRRIMAPESSDSVALIQEALVVSGIALPDHGVDGTFGSETGAAVTAFKTDRELHPNDPVVGPGTTNRLDQEAAYSEGIPVEEALRETSIVVRDPWAGAILDGVRPDLTIPDRILKFFELSDEFCFSMSLQLTSLAGSFFGSLVEPFIDRDYCKLNGPCGADDFFDTVNDHAPYTAFLRSHNPAIGSAVIDATGLGRRPDILSHRTTVQPEWYEIKPLSPAGVREGLEKGIELRATYAAGRFPYKPGKLYTPSKEIELGRFVSDAGEQLEVFLEVTRPVPGLIFYRICIRGDYVSYFNRVRLIAGILAILAALAAEAAAAAATAEAAAATIAAIQELAAGFGVSLPLLSPGH